MPNLLLLFLLILLPLGSFLLNGIWGRNFLKQFSPFISCTFSFASMCFAFYSAYAYFFRYGLQNGAYQKFIPFQYEWLHFSDTLSIHMGFLLDPITMMMLVVVTFISFMVHLYSAAYLHGEERLPTYYSFLGLFTFSMLGLVVASNIFQTYFFWELVGVSSFLLIGYYFQKPSAVAACKKAFIVTRFADAGFLIGILLLGSQTNSFDYVQIIQHTTEVDLSIHTNTLGATFIGISGLTWAMILIFIGGAGKSAMFPLHIWLPDAMEGPTPVSALIHAATMVVAGVFLVARLFPVYAVAVPDAQHIVSYIGIVSACFAAIIACTQTDIKRILAFSTMSQIGFMMFALGVSNYHGEASLGFTASLFHLFTHALFKALLFLGAGAIIHAVHSNDIHEMGGLWKRLPITHITFLIACLAIAGIPPFAGFFSKEEILYAAFHQNKTVFYLALVTSTLTAFYMFRLYFCVFWHKQINTPNAHEAGWTMTLPLIVLAFCSAFAGWIPFGEFVSADGIPHHSEFHLQFSIVPVLLALFGIGFAAFLYKKENATSNKLVKLIPAIYQTIYNKFYVDELYLFLTKKIIFPYLGKTSAWIDKYVIDASVEASGSSTQWISEKIKHWQSGKVQEYAMYFLVATICVVIALLCIKN